MMRNSVLKLARATPARRSFSVMAARAADGEQGAIRYGSSSSGSDAFNKREQASENKFIREKEMESLKKLKEKLAAQRKHLDELDQHIKELESERGGEHN